MFRVGQNHTFIGIYGVHTVSLAGKSPYIRSNTVQIYGSGQPYSYLVEQGGPPRPSGTKVHNWQNNVVVVSWPMELGLPYSGDGKGLELARTTFEFAKCISLLAGRPLQHSHTHSVCTFVCVLSTWSHTQ